MQVGHVDVELDELVAVVNLDREQADVGNEAAC